MNRRTVRGNRLGLAVVGVILILLGVAGLLLWAFTPTRPILTPELTHPLLLWGVAVLGVIVALLGLRWLIVQGRRTKRGTFRLESGPTGDTELTSDGVARAVAADAAASPAVLEASADLGSGGEVRMDLVADEEAPMSAVVAQLSEVAIPRMRSALETPKVPAVAHVTLREARHERVVE